MERIVALEFVANQTLGILEHAWPQLKFLAVSLMVIARSTLTVVMVSIVKARDKMVGCHARLLLFNSQRRRKNRGKKRKIFKITILVLDSEYIPVPFDKLNTPI